MKTPFYISFDGDCYPEKYAYKICAMCGGEIPYSKNGIGVMFCNLDCASEYWKLDIELLDAEVYKSNQMRLSNYKRLNRHLFGTLKCIIKDKEKRLGGIWKSSITKKDLSEKDLIKYLSDEFEIENDKWKLKGVSHQVIHILSKGESNDKKEET